MDALHAEEVSSFRKHGVPILFAAFVPMLTGAAYLTGLAYYQTYLHVFHVSAALVPITTADHFVYAYFAISLLVQGILKSFWIAAVIAGLVFWAVFQWLLMDSLSGKVRQSRLGISVQAWLRRRLNPAASRLIFMPAALTVATIYLILFLAIMLIIPVELGRTAGRLRAQEDISAFSKGCDHPAGSSFCNSILESGKQPINGYIIGGSEKNVIVFDGKTTVILVRGDKTTIADVAKK